MTADPADITARFAWHPPDLGAAGRHSAVRETCMSLAFDLVEYVPSGRELALALTNLEQVMFWANAAIARHPLVEPVVTGNSPGVHADVAGPFESIGSDGCNECTCPTYRQGVGSICRCSHSLHVHAGRRL